MDLEDSDACDGRAKQRQGSALAFLAIAPIIGFFLLKNVIDIGCKYFFGSTAGYWSEPLVILIIGFTLASFHNLFWVNVDGNRIQPAIDVFFPKKLSDGSTRFIVYTAGFAFKLPWISLQGNLLEIEKRRTNATDEFTITVGNTSLEVSIKIAWKPHTHFISTYLQNATTVDGEELILNQIIAYTKMQIEERAANETDPEEVRRKQSQVIKDVFDIIHAFAEEFGIEILNISFAKCDYSKLVQTQKDQVKASQSIEEIRNALIGSGVSPRDAALLAALQSGVQGIKITDFGLGSTGPVLGPILEKLTGGKK